MWCLKDRLSAEHLTSSARGMELERRWRCALAASAFNSAVWAASSRAAFTTAAVVATLQAE